MVLNPFKKNGQTKKIKSFHSRLHIIREIINCLIFVFKDVNKKNNKRSTLIDSNALTGDVLALIKKKPKKEYRIPQNQFTQDNDFVEFELFTPKHNNTERGKVIPERNNSQINPRTETHNATIKEKLFKTPRGGSTRESKTTNTNNKSKSTKRPVPNVATQQKRDSVVETAVRSKGEEFPNRGTISTSQNVTLRRYQTRNASGKI